jgi:hypothetical protein
MSQIRQRRRTDANQKSKCKTTTQKSKIQPIGPLGQNQRRIPARRESFSAKQSQFSTDPSERKLSFSKGL